MSEKQETPLEWVVPINSSNQPLGGQKELVTPHRLSKAMNSAVEAHKSAEQVRKDSVVRDAQRIMDILLITRGDYPEETLNHRMNQIYQIAERIVLHNSSRF